MLSTASAAATLVAFSSFNLVSAQLLADGYYFQAGNINTNWRWQASGQLAHGRCPFNLGFTDCYSSQLAASGNLQETTQADYIASVSSSAAAVTSAPVTFYPASYSRTLAAAKPQTPEEQALLDDEDLDAYFEAFPDQEPYRLPGYQTLNIGPGFKAKRQVVGCGDGGTTTTTTAPSSTTSGPVVTPTVSPRQRNEIFTWPGAVAGETWTYTWKSFQSRGTSTNYNFFHSWQILRRDGCGGAVITLDYVNGKVVVQDAVRGCKACVTYPKSLLYWFGFPVVHKMTITYGLSGSIDYKAYVGGNLRNPAIAYTATGDMGSSASLKFGNYRRWTADVSAASAYVGDFSATRVA
ncbi:hypothetical protein JCM10207_008014 [Rhodosporidiobolus poonsookiae]